MSTPSWTALSLCFGARKERAAPHRCKGAADYRSVAYAEIGYSIPDHEDKHLSDRSPCRESIKIISHECSDAVAVGADWPPGCFPISRGLIPKPRSLWYNGNYWAGSLPGPEGWVPRERSFAAFRADIAAGGRAMSPSLQLLFAGLLVLLNGFFVAAEFA